jgi:septal ring factor EnvC (AmiA/AmiB activator)
MMRNLNAFLLTAALFLSVSVLAGCENGDKTQETNGTGSELTQTQKELEQIKKDSTELEKYVTNLKEQINALKIENQRLIAQTKRLEAEIIDLKLDLGQVPDSDSADMLDKDSEPGDSSKNTGTEQPESLPETPADGNKGAVGEAGTIHRAIQK